MKNTMATSDLPPKFISQSINKELVFTKELLGRHLTRSETKESALAYFRGLIGGTERKNSWQLSEAAGRRDPYAFQYLLGRALWNADELRDDVRAYTGEHLGTAGGILAVDETGFLKKGTKSAGVGRQYSGTAGRIENCQIGVFLSYAAVNGRALIDRELYIPHDWFEDKERCREAGVPEAVAFKTKPELAKTMLERTFAAGIKPGWVVGDEVYSCGALRAWLEGRNQPYVLAAASNCTVYIGFKHYKARDLLTQSGNSNWKKISAGEGTKGRRYYEWQRTKINSDSPEGWGRWLLLRRNIKNKEDIAFYIAFSSGENTLEDMAKAAGGRWTIEECFEMAKGEVGLDHYEVRSWRGWYRHITLSIFSLSFLVKLRAQLDGRDLQLRKKKRRRRQLSMQTFLQDRGLA